MTIRKYLHSCLGIEQNWKRLLVDPGQFCFIENKITPEDIGPVDALLLTHKHGDHYYPEALKKILAQKQAPIIAHPEIGELIAEEGLEWQKIQPGETKEIAGFHVASFEAPHERLPVPCPHNSAYRINGSILLPGDSYGVIGVEHCDILALPVAGPWSQLAHGIDFAKLLKPRIVIPIHDAIIKDFMLERIYDMCRVALEGSGIDFQPLGLGDILEVE